MDAIKSAVDLLCETFVLPTGSTGTQRHENQIKLFSILVPVGNNSKGAVTHSERVVVFISLVAEDCN